MYEKSTDMYFFHELMQLYYYLHCSSLLKPVMLMTSLIA